MTRNGSSQPSTVARPPTKAVNAPQPFSRPPMKPPRGSSFFSGGAGLVTSVTVTVANAVRCVSDLWRACSDSRSDSRSAISSSMLMISLTEFARSSSLRNDSSVAFADRTRASTSATSPVTSSACWLSESLVPSCVLSWFRTSVYRSVGIFSAISERAGSLDVDSCST